MGAVIAMGAVLALCVFKHDRQIFGWLCLLAAFVIVCLSLKGVL